jgi:hypothetical protein
VNDDKLISLQMNRAAHAHFKPGLAYDLIVIDNGSVRGQDYMESIKAIRRENEGYSFGGWKFAWERFKNDYDYFLFTEDDMAPSKEGWLREIMDLFLSEPFVGAVGSSIEVHTKGSNEYINGILDMCERNEIYNLDGCFTFTSSEVLRKVDAIGGLRVIPTGTDHGKGVTNELRFQQPILELGYGIKAFNDVSHFVIHGSEAWTNDLKYRGPIVEPILNLNARFNVPEVKEIYSHVPQH